MERGSQRWPEMRTEALVWFFCKTSLPFNFVLPVSTSSLVHIIFRTITQILVVSSSSNTLPSSSMPSVQFMRYFHSGTTCVLFTLNKCNFRYSTQTTDAAFLPEHMHPVYFRQQVRFLLYYPRNLPSMLKEPWVLHCSKNLLNFSFDMV